MFTAKDFLFIFLLNFNGKILVHLFFEACGYTTRVLKSIARIKWVKNKIKGEDFFCIPLFCKEGLGKI